MTGLTLLAAPALPLALQLASMALWSVVAVAVGRRWYRDYPVGGRQSLNRGASRLVGETVTVERAIEGGTGRVRVGDGSWPARGDDAAVGSTVRIVAVEDGIVSVEPTPD